LKRTLSIAAALITLGGIFAILAPTASASYCQGDGSGCTAAGVYFGPNALVNGNYNGFRVAWTSSTVQPYSTIPSPWLVDITYTNVTSSPLTLGCPGNWVNASYVSEEMSGGTGDDGGVAASSTTCSQNPGLSVTVQPGDSYTAFASFGNVPWPGSTVAIQWGDAGTTASVTPWTCPEASSPWGGYAACGVNTNSVKATWAVPPAIVSGSPRNSGAGFWVGLGGTTGNLEQAGTASDVVNGKPLYFAFYELTPNAPVQLSQSKYPVRPGDAITATVTLANGDQYHFKLTDRRPGSSTNEWAFSTTKSYSAGSHNSAEVIAEDSGGLSGLPPGCPMTNFSTVAFSGIKIGGYTIGSYHPSVYQMGNGDVSLSSLRKGTAYTAYFEHS
jgi:hypothetical protein